MIPQPPKAPNYVLTAQLFKHCMDFNLSSTALISKTEELRRVGINAQVLAAHSDEGGRVAGTLVSEIGTLTVQVSTVMQELSASGAELARSSIATTTYGQLLRKYREAWDKGLAGTTADTLLGVYEDYSDKMDANFEQIRNRLGPHLRTLDDLRRTVMSIPPLISLLKITEANLDATGELFNNTAGELDRFHTFVLTVTAAMTASVNEALNIVGKILFEASKT